MRWIAKAALAVLILAAVALLGAAVLINPFGPSPLNTYRKDGELKLSGLKRPVRICRDEKNMAAIYADDLDDLMFAQGYVMAMDRLFQMELTKRLAAGRIGEVVGEQARALDLRMRTLGFHRQAERHLALLGGEVQAMLQQFVAGINAAITTRPQELPLEFRLAGIRPTLWTPADSLAIFYYMGWNSAANLQNEVISQALVEKLGRARAAELFPLNLNPAEPSGSQEQAPPAQAAVRLEPQHLQNLLALLPDGRVRLGSNNWVIGPGLSRGLPILANDPHLEGSLLPGPWYPCSLFTDRFHAVGVTIAGTPGIAIGRTDYLAFGATNAYGDAQDLYIETVDPADPGHYLEGSRSIPFEEIEETLRFKNKQAPEGYSSEKVRIRLTRRGPVVSDVMPGLPGGQVVSLRWSAYESMGPSLGLERLLACRSSAQFRDALQDVTVINLNYVFADQQGHIGWQVTGRLPIRGEGEGRLPYVVRSSQDNWRGWIPFDQMPHGEDPEVGWLGTTNNKTTFSDYPYYFSDFYATSFRQERLMQLMADADPQRAADQWRYQRDISNLKAERVAPIMAAALLGNSDTAQFGRILQAWDHRDSADQAAPTLFHAIFDEFAYQAFADELGPELTRLMLADTYYWEQRLVAMIQGRDSAWFDDRRTPDVVETQEALWQRAALIVAPNLSARLGRDASEWRWGRIHRYEFISPVARNGFAKRWLGGGSHPAEGSGDTLCRAKTPYGDLSRVGLMASLRMVVDLGDPDKMMAVLPGGVSGRLLDPHMTDQIDPYIKGDVVYWWFSDREIQAHAKHRQTLLPAGMSERKK